jgi:hypothetical protein|tara:strand:+ start:1050 stop:1439 length:390 start_codon:yes stop_codon:yes gene_type:complete
MIRTLIIAFLVSFLSVTALAEHENQPTTPTPEVTPDDRFNQPFNKLPIMIDCGIKENIFEVLRRYNEEPVLSMEVIIQTPNSGILRQPGMLFMNRDKSTWSLVAYFPETGGACIVQNGINIAAVQRPSS